MDTLIRLPQLSVIQVPKMEIFIVILLLAFCSSGWWLGQLDATAALLDLGIIQLLLLSIISFLFFTSLCWWLLRYFWFSLGLPSIHTMVLQFKHLVLWQQFAFYWASFALLFLGSLLSLAAIF